MSEKAVRKPMSRTDERKLSFKAKGRCMWCRREPIQNQHHIDGNRSNNRIGNVILLCATCHSKAHSGKITREQLRRRLGICRLDLEIRGIIEENIEYVFENQNFLETVRWILEADDNVTSEDDLALGYFLGSLTNISAEKVRQNKVFKESDKRLQRKLGKERFRELTESRRKARAKSRPLKSEITQEETEYVRNILINWIGRFRKKIRNEETQHITET